MTGPGKWGTYSDVPREERPKQRVSVLIYRQFRHCIASWETINEKKMRLDMTIYT